MIETARLILKPLTYRQLLIYAKADNSLEEELGLFHSTRIISSELKEALENTIIPNVADTSRNYLYSTLWTAISKVDNTMIGDLCILGEPNSDGEVEIGYGTYQQFQGRGYMTEIIAGIIEWLKGEPKVFSIVASTDKQNLASIAVLRKNGFVQILQNENMFTWRLKLLDQ